MIYYLHLYVLDGGGSRVWTDYTFGNFRVVPILVPMKYLQFFMQFQLKEEFVFCEGVEKKQ